MTDIPMTGKLPYRAVALLAPFLLLLVQLGLLYATLSPDQFLLMAGLMVAYILPPAGKETIIPIGIALGLPWWYMALSIAMIDIETGLFMALNFDLAYMIPYAGKALVDFTDKTKKIIVQRRWIADFYFLAIVLIVMVPVLGSGGIRGSIIGKLLGMESWLVFLAIVMGALLGSFLIALGAEVLIVQLCASGVLPPDISAVVCNQT